MSGSNKSRPIHTRDVHGYAELARSKLGRAAAADDHNLRLLVGQANFLDDIMDTLYSPVIEDDSGNDQLDLVLTRTTSRRDGPPSPVSATQIPIKRPEWQPPAVQAKLQPTLHRIDEHDGLASQLGVH